MKACSLGGGRVVRKWSVSRCDAISSYLPVCSHARRNCFHTSNQTKANAKESDWDHRTAIQSFAEGRGHSLLDCSLSLGSGCGSGRALRVGNCGGSGLPSTASGMNENMLRARLYQADQKPVREGCSSRVGAELRLTTKGTARSHCNETAPKVRSAAKTGNLEIGFRMVYRCLGLNFDFEADRYEL
jgi:hypothetical protein